MRRVGLVLGAISVIVAGCSSGYPVLYQSFPESATLVCNGISKGYTPITVRYDYDKDLIKEGDSLAIDNCRAIWMSGAEAQYPNSVRYSPSSKGESLGVERPKGDSGFQKDMAFDFQKKEADRQRKQEEEALKIERERLELEKKHYESNGSISNVDYPHLLTYSKDAHNVYYGKRKVESADAASFTVLSYGYAKDLRNVYYQGVKIRGARGDSFVVLSSNYGKDQFNVYFQGTEIPRARSRSFEVLSTHYAKDVWDVYYKNQRIQGAVSSTFKVLDTQYSKDNRDVYFEGQKINGAHISTFTIEDRGYARDYQQRYYRGQKIAD